MQMQLEEFIEIGAEIYIELGNNQIQKIGNGGVI